MGLMTFDRRYPHMIPIDGRHIPGLDDSDRRSAERVGKLIASRTQTHPFWNLYTGGIFFSRYAQPTMAPYELPFKPNGGPARRMEPHQIDEVVSYINLSLIPDETKEKWRAQKESAAERELADSRRAKVQDDAHDIESYAAFLDRKRRGTQTLVKVL